MNGHLAKPIDMDEVVKVICRVLTGSDPMKKNLQNSEAGRKGVRPLSDSGRHPRNVLSRSQGWSDPLAKRGGLTGRAKSEKISSVSAFSAL